MYERQLCSMNNVLAYVWKYSCLLQDKSSVGFGRWCSGKDIDLMRTTTKRQKVDERATISVRSLHVLKEKYIGKALGFFYIHLIIQNAIVNAVKYIVEQLPRYQQTIESFKKDGYNVIGYVRKSRTKETDETRTKLLNMMCKKLKTHSMVDKVFVSFKTNTNEPIIDRDIDDDKKVLEEIDADGNTQGKNIIIGSFFTHTPLMLKFPDMLKYVSAQKTCLVTLTFAGLTTNVDDLVTLLT